MNRFHVIVFIAVVFTWIAIGRADDSADADGWISLFDGRSLAGWHKNPQRIGHGTGGHWVVKEGVIVGEQDPPGSGNGGMLLTDRTFADFELMIDLKPDWGVDSGLFLRSTDKGECFQMTSKSASSTARRSRAETTISRRWLIDWVRAAALPCRCTAEKVGPPAPNAAGEISRSRKSSSSVK